AGYKEREFHFAENKHETRITFLKTVQQFSFQHFSIVIDKKKLTGPGFKYKESFYKYACWLVCNNAQEYLTSPATFVIDKSGSKEFAKSLKKYLRKNIEKDDNPIRDIRPRHSHGDNLLQLADYIASLTNSYMQNKTYSSFYKNQLKHHQGHVQIWPK
ncbi:MAG: DUF3800 domain-containing protein, partial [Candidatus Paceibacteria bacterium]